MLKGESAMSNEIKLDSTAATSYVQYNTSPSKESVPSVTPSEEVQVSNTVDSLVRSLAQNPTSTIDDKRVDAMIEALKNGQYRVDYNRLAHTLVMELINTSRLPGEASNGHS
jgi:flagellar biosynthesis anti-sigma factor FlgM